MYLPLTWAGILTQPGLPQAVPVPSPGSKASAAPRLLFASVKRLAEPGPYLVLSDNDPIVVFEDHAVPHCRGAGEVDRLPIYAAIDYADPLDEAPADDSDAGSAG